MDRGRGMGWVVGQFAVMAVVLGLGVAPPDWPRGAHLPLLVIGTALAAAGAGVAVWASVLLGRGFTPYPRPAPVSQLVVTGPYRVVRHPVYAGGLLFFAGYSASTGPLALAGTVALGVVWALKSRVEERYLRERYPEYDAYTDRVPFRLVPYRR